MTASNVTAHALLFRSLIALLLLSALLVLAFPPSRTVTASGPEPLVEARSEPVLAAETAGAGCGNRSRSLTAVWVPADLPPRLRGHTARCPI